MKRREEKAGVDDTLKGNLVGMVGQAEVKRTAMGPEEHPGGKHQI